MFVTNINMEIIQYIVYVKISWYCYSPFFVFININVAIPSVLFLIESQSLSLVGFVKTEHFKRVHLLSLPPLFFFLADQQLHFSIFLCNSKVSSLKKKKNK